MHKINILYVHGLESTLSENKKAILEEFGNVIAPIINYRENDLLKKLKSEFHNFDIVIGSSIGGYMGFIMASIFNKPCLLFNPAFVYRSIQPNISNIDIPDKKTSYTKIILGEEDQIINYKDNLSYILNNIKLENLKIKSIKELAHRIPKDVFEVEVKTFINEL